MTELERLQALKADITALRDADLVVKNEANQRIIAYDNAIVEVDQAIASLP